MRCLVLTVVAACGGAVVPQPIANRVASAPRHDCGEQLVARLTTKLVARWNVDKLDVRCAAGRFGVEGFFIEARNADLRRTGIVDASGAELVPFVDEPEPEPATFINGYQAADLDGDGEDEIIESWRRTHETLEADNWLVVRRVSNGTFSSRIQGPYISRYHPDLGGCSATWELRAGSILISVDVKPGIPPTDCLPQGKHRFALRGRSLVDRRVN
jgi:hypothetical protein